MFILLLLLQLSLFAFDHVRKCHYTRSSWMAKSPCNSQTLHLLLKM